MDLRDHKTALNSIGWFIPPYIKLGFITMLQTAIDAGKITDPQHLEPFLAPAYSHVQLAAMIRKHYSIAPFVKDYLQIITEAAEAHFSGLHHVAVSGIVPVIEGVARKLAADRSVAAAETAPVKELFSKLADDCKKEAVNRGVGDVDEIVTMMDAFVVFTNDYLYARSQSYPLVDKMNRHGMLHGAFADGDYGRPINFYKAIGSLDILCMIAGFRATLSGFAPETDDDSNRLAIFFLACTAIGALRPT